MLRSGVAIVQSVCRVVNGDTGETIIDRKPYWCVTSRSLGRCGHRHRSKEACEPCFKVMMERKTEQRKSISLNVRDEKRRAKILARDYEPSVSSDLKKSLIKGIPTIKDLTPSLRRAAFCDLHKATMEMFGSTHGGDNWNLNSYDVRCGTCRERFGAAKKAAEAVLRIWKARRVTRLVQGNL